MCGVQMLGGRVFDDGCAMTERTLVTLGRDCTLNAGSTIQCHSLEDATFKSDGIVIGAGCTVGTNGFVHYGVTMGEGSALATDSFLMKGSEVRPRSRWAGNPAAETPTADRSGQAAPSDAREAGTARPG
jgi:non-ribosomal peptide synthetase-like protein